MTIQRFSFRSLLTGHQAGRVPVLGVVFATLVLAACGGGSDAQRVARRFMDTHYVYIDLDAASEVCSGLALSKLDRERELTSEVQIEADTLKPRVNYALETERATADKAQMVYVLTIRPPGIEPFERLMTLTLRQQDGVWSVSNYSDGEPPSVR